MNKVPAGWHAGELRRFLDRVTYGFTNPMPTTESGPWKLTAADIQDGRINYSTSRHTSQFAYDNDLTDKSRPQINDVLLTKDGSIGRVAIVDRWPVCINQSVALLRPNALIDPEFLKYLLSSPHYQNKMAADADGTTILHIYITRVDKMRIVVPPIEEQRRIASVLSCLDQKIGLNRRMNETLEAIARAIFKSWFVDFDPVRAKAEGRQPFGMDAETAALFPDSFEDSPLGKIPKGWKAMALPDALQINPARSLVRGQQTTYLDMQNVPTSGHRPAGWIQRAFVSGSKFANGDTLLARITPCLENGKTAYVDFLKDNEVGWGSTEFIVLRPILPLPPEYGYCLARNEDFRSFAIQNMTGSSGRQRVPTNCLTQYLLAVPSSAVAEAFGQMVRPLFAKIKANSEECATLSAARDALLPKLISGEIRVADCRGAS